MNNQYGGPILRSLLTLSCAVNSLGAIVLLGTFGLNWLSDPQRHVPIIVAALGASMLIQALFTYGYLSGWWNSWGETATGALLAGQLISGCVGLGMVLTSVFFVQDGGADFEPTPLIAGLLIGTNALTALIFLATSARAEPRR